MAKPHIGTFRLVKIVENMRATIESLGGEFRFQTKVTDLVLENKRVTGVKLHNDDSIPSNHACSPWDTAPRYLPNAQEQGVYAEAKPFSIGFRIEHPQS